MNFRFRKKKIKFPKAHCKSQKCVVSLIVSCIQPRLNINKMGLSSSANIYKSSPRRRLHTPAESQFYHL